MNEIKDLIEAIESGHTKEIKTIFESILGERLMVAIADKKREIAESTGDTGESLEEAEKKDSELSQEQLAKRRSRMIATARMDSKEDQLSSTTRKMASRQIDDPHRQKTNARSSELHSELSSHLGSGNHRAAADTADKLAQHLRDSANSEENRAPERSKKEMELLVKRHAARKPISNYLFNHLPRKQQ